MSITNLNQFKQHKKQAFIKCIKKQIISDYELTPKDMNDEMVYKLNIFANQIYDFHDFIKNRPLN